MHSYRMDIEAEMGRFEMALEAEAQKYTFVNRPIAPAERQAVVAADTLATCCCGELLIAYNFSDSCASCSA
jgi:hypothetical protein